MFFVIDFLAVSASSFNIFVFKSCRIIVHFLIPTLEASSQLCRKVKTLTTNCTAEQTKHVAYKPLKFLFKLQSFQAFNYNLQSSIYFCRSMYPRVVPKPSSKTEALYFEIPSFGNKRKTHDYHRPCLN